MVIEAKGQSFRGPGPGQFVGEMMLWWFSFACAAFTLPVLQVCSFSNILCVLGKGGGCAWEGEHLVTGMN